mmetsp:Transcript_15841/g.35666  ORF Transcript_15841/g.35666 Transcript_15841/m.35666 type:complete len:125 (-) Transcript_15841:43-417(-)
MGSANFTPDKDDSEALIGELLRSMNVLENFPDDSDLCFDASWRKVHIIPLCVALCLSSSFVCDRSMGLPEIDDGENLECGILRFNSLGECMCLDVEDSIAAHPIPFFSFISPFKFEFRYKIIMV